MVKQMASFVLRVISLLAVLGVAMPAHATTSFITGASCNDMDVGTTHMASNNMDILACLLNTSGNKVWKSMTSEGSPPGSMCGYVLMLTPSASSSVLGCADRTGLTPSAPVNNYVVREAVSCNGSPIYRSNGNSYSLVCPEGYTTRLLFCSHMIAQGDETSFYFGPQSIFSVLLPSIIGSPQPAGMADAWTCVKD